MASSRPLALLASTLLLSAPAWADDLFVPGQFGVIQDAIDAAQPGDRVLVQQVAGDYAENLIMRAGVSVIGVGDQMPTIANPGGGLPTVSFPDPNTGRETLLSGLRLINGVSGLGAGVLLSMGASPTISDNLIEYQQSQWGAGIFAMPHGDPLIEDNTIRLCEALKGGGGIFLFMPGPQAQVHNNLIEQNRTTLFGGGAILWGGTALLTYNSFEQNQSQGDGGGLWVKDTDLFAYGNDFEGNSASSVSGRGGGAYLRSLASDLLYHGAFRENVANEGGGLYLDDCTAAVRWVDFEDNRAQESGGGVFAGGWQGAVTLSACDLRRNRAGEEMWLGEGGGIFCDGAIDLEVVNCVLYSNSAGYSWQSGSGIRVRSAELVLVVNNTLVENLVNDLPVPGSGLAIGAAADARVTNNWFAQHELHVVRDNVVVPVTLRTNLYSSNDLGNLVLDPTDGIDLPLFVNPGVDFHILPGDPGINRGSPWLQGVPSRDMDGQWRQWGKVDVGADELGK